MRVLPLISTVLLIGCGDWSGKPHRGEPEPEATPHDAGSDASINANTDASMDAGEVLAAMDASADASADASTDAACEQLSWEEVLDGKFPGAQPSPNDAGALTVQVLFENSERVPVPDHWEYWDKAPAAVSVPLRLMWAGSGRPLVVLAEQHWTVVAPALGDRVVISQSEMYPSSEPFFPGPTYDASFEPLTTSAENPTVSAFAGKLHCAVGSANIDSNVAASVSLQLKRSNGGCSLPVGDNIFAVANDALGRTLGVAQATLPALPAEVPPAPTLEFGDWQALEPVSLKVSGNSTKGTFRSWIRSQDLRLPLESLPQPLLDPASTEETSLHVPRALADSFEVEVQTKVSEKLTASTRTRRVASATEVDLALDSELPKIASIAMASGPCGEDARLSWTLADGQKKADAVVVTFVKRYRATSCCEEFYRETVVAPPDVLSVPVRQFPEWNPYGQPIPLVLYSLESITYIDADYIDGYRDFLKEPLAEDEDYRLERDLPVDGTIRSIRFTPYELAPR